MAPAEGGGPTRFTEQDFRDQEEFRVGTRKMMVLGVAFATIGILWVGLFRAAFVSPASNWDNFFAGILLGIPAFGCASLILWMSAKRFQISQDWVIRK